MQIQFTQIRIIHIIYFKSEHFKGMLRTLFSFLLMFISFYEAIAVQRKLLLVQQIARHGARNPQYSLPGDYFSEVSYKRASQGQLTTAGKSMHYKLGKIIRKLYWQQLFGNTEFQQKYHQSKFFIKSTDYNRTIQSAQSQLLGLLEGLPPLQITKDQLKYSLPPWANNETFNNITQENITVFGEKGSIFQPTVIHTDKSTATALNQGDYLLAGQQQNCPAQVQNIAQNLNSKLANQVKNDPQMVLAHRELEKYFNTSIDFWKIYRYYGNYKALKHMREPYATIFEHPKYRSAYEFLGKFTIYLKYFNTNTQKKIAGSLFFQQILGVMDRAIKGLATKYPYNIQFQLFLGHDVTVSAIVSALNAVSPQCMWNSYKNIYSQSICINKQIDFATNSILQLWRQSDQTYSVSFRFNGQLIPLSFCQSDLNQKCDYFRFKQYISGNIIISDQQMQNICLITQDNFVYHLEIALILIAIVLAVVSLTYLCESKPTKMKRDLVQYQLDDNILNANVNR